MKSVAQWFLLLSLTVSCLSCQQELQKESAPQTKPVAGAPERNAGETSAAGPKTPAPKISDRKAGERPTRTDDRPQVERLIDNLRDKDWLLRREAAEALGKLGDKRAVEPLIAVLKDEDNSVRFNAMSSLGKLGDARAVDPLIASLKNKDINRACAAEALGNLGDKRAVEPLISCLKDSEIDRSRAAQALGKLGDQRAVEPLIASLKDADERVRREAADALGKFGDKRAVEPLFAALPDWPIKDAIGTALKQLDAKPATDKERFYFRVAVLDDKGLLEDWKETRQLILDDAGSQDTRKVQNAIYTVIALGKEELVDDLVRLLNSREDKETAEIYLNCCHQGLSKAAEKWAAHRGYNVPGGAGSSGPGWGRW